MCVIEYSSYLPTKLGTSGELAEKDLNAIVEVFPKNLALLKRSMNNMETSPGIDYKDNNNFCNTLQRDISFNDENQETGDSCQKFCDTHSQKQLEAF